MSEAAQPQLSTHEAAMVAKVDAAQANLQPQGQAQPDPVSVPARPENVPEKFWDPEKGTVRTDELLKSYGLLEAERAKPAATETPKATDGDAAAAAAVAAAKLDMGKLNEEFASSGKLSDESYQALQAAGFDKNIVDSYIAGQAALAQQFDAKAYGAAGGQEEYDKMVQWAAANLSQAEQDTFNTAVAGNEAQMLLAVQGLKARYTETVGKDPALVQGAGGGGSGSTDTPFASRAEVTAAMRDPRYRNDSAYRATVERRVGLMETF